MSPKYAGLVLNITRFALNITGLSLKFYGYVLNMTGFGNLNINIWYGSFDWHMVKINGSSSN